MNNRINQLVKSILQKNSLDQCSLADIQQFAEKHPYLGVIQLLLTQKMQTERPEQYEEQLKKTYLFFHNPLWVEHVLHDTGSAQIMADKTETPDISTQTSATADIDSVREINSLSQEKNIPETNTQMSSKFTQHTDVTIEVSEKSSAAHDDIFFEPYHTVDYFASQGITYQAEENPADKFGRQLKSFTEWLKLMKRLPYSSNALNADWDAEQKAAKMAESSLTNREVITESMAAVWEKQGNKEKAIEVYTKLSLLEPSKSLYFAAKIEQLKNQL